MYLEGITWAGSQGIPVSVARPTDTSTSLWQHAVMQLITQLRLFRQPIFVLIDEVQRFFSVESDWVDSLASPSDFFKKMVLQSTSGGLYFVLTGSSMCQAWLGFSLAQVNGYSLHGIRDVVYIPVNQDERVAKFCIEQLRR